MKDLSIICCLVACITTAGCNTSTQSDPVVKVEHDNEKMNAAMEKARDTFPLFLRNWKTMPNDGASVKIAVPTPDDSLEHIWFEPITITNDEVTGTCANDPANVPGLKYGDKRTFKRSDISDWMIMVGRKCYGGYTIRVLCEIEPEGAPPLEFADFENAE